MTAMRPTPTEYPGYSETMPCEAQSAGRARRLIDAAISTWGMESLADNAMLVVSELVGNSVQHTECRLIRVAIHRPTTKRIRVSVSDLSRAAPVVKDPKGEAEEGRGLLLVSALADCWDTDHRRWGKVVWAELVAKPVDGT